ncbi:CD209 antigen-like protein D [Silurus meridionalis]|nr:CD209 antigen-like protein D [Silurus meridionalis]
MSWYGAQAYCRKYYTDLASSTTATQNSQLEQVFLLQGSSWFGLFRDTWKWVDNPLQDATNLQWYTGQPNNFAGNEDCVVIFNGLLVDRPCMNLNFFFCHTIIRVQEQQILKLHVNSDESVFDPFVQAAMLKLIKQKLEEYGMLKNTTVTWRLQPNGNIFNKQTNKKDDI